MNVSAEPAQAGLGRRERIWLAIHRGLDRWLSPLGVLVYRRTRGGVTRPWHVDALLLTTRGRRSGRRRTVVLQYFPDGDAMVVAAANDGGTTHPGWYHNLHATPEAEVEVMGRNVPVRAEELRPTRLGHGGIGSSLGIRVTSATRARRPGRSRSSAWCRPR